MSDVDTAMLATLVAVTVTLLGLPVAFFVGKRQERAGGRHERARVYPKIATAMDLFVDEVEMIVFLHDLEMIAAQAHEGMEESARREIVDRGTYLRNEFRRLLQGHSAVLPIPVAAKLWAVDNAYRLLIRPTSDERIDLARIAVLAAASDEAREAMRMDSQADAG